MKKLLSALFVLAIALPASATPARFPVVDPDEAMVVVPGLEQLGPSRISTVEFCQKLYGTNDWRSLITDNDFDGMRDCLLEHT